MASPYSGEFANLSFTLPYLLPPSQWDEGPPERPPEGVSITITKRRGEGAIHETFDAALRLHPDDTPKPCILRSADVELFRNGDFSMNDARRAVLKEAAIYHRLGPLQGTVVPRYWGIGNELHYDEPLEHATALVSVMDDGGTEVPEDEMGNHTIREQIRDIYRALHGAGVIHNDVAWRHILRDRDGKLCLIDFDQARLRHEHGYTDASWKSRCNREMRDVEDMWVDYDDQLGDKEDSGRSSDA